MILVLLAGIAAGTLTVCAREISVREQYENYQAVFESIQTEEEIALNGYEIIEKHRYSVYMESFGDTEVQIVPALETTWMRLAVFIADMDGNILYRTNDLEANYIVRGQMKQPNIDLVSIAFSDLNQDGLTDIILITGCENETGEFQDKTYKVGDVLFQGDRSFYRDWRISDKINRFSMNKSANCIAAFLRDGRSTEFLYTATTWDELEENGFTVIEEQCYQRNYEKLGTLWVLPGVFRIADYDIFMIYMVDEQGNIVWSFQPMGDYDNLYALRGTTGKDMDGDGMKDLGVLARYSYEGENGELLTEMEISIYYQRTGGFEEDTEFRKTYRCTGEETLEEMVAKIRAFWGWSVEDVTLQTESEE